MSKDRLAVLKTYKLFIDGKFPRTESGRSLAVSDLKGNLLAHLCHASRKDLRNSVVAARKAQKSWAARTAFNRGQILYRMAEMLEGKRGEFAQALAATCSGGMRRANKEVDSAIDCLVNFAGWADKYSQVVGCNNPVAGPFYNFTSPEAVGVVGVIAANENPLLSLVGMLAPVIVSGNTAVALGSDSHPLTTSIFAEVCATSDVPQGVINLLTSKRKELLAHFANHRDIDAIAAAECTANHRKTLELGAAENLKRVRISSLSGDAWYDCKQLHSPYRIERFVEMKTVWHPIGR
ncbi:MAG: aldehyde dehydrogenase family protein [Planctomycetota bacterium]|jgi:acyl-CoA reductase-like NAD-dependent aldehyde dehydrogenase|nr:aldehyde dehydrogenase family protein [Planctomycetota bacterium]